MKKLNAKRRHSLVSSYNAMIQRCYNQSNPQWKDYGGRGISVCQRWLPGQTVAQGFWNFVDDMGEKPEGTTLDRINNSEDYKPENCKWSTKAEQQRNRRNNITIEYKGKKMIVEDWAKEIGVSRSTILYRYHKGWPTEIVLSTKNYRGKSL